MKILGDNNGHIQINTNGVIIYRLNIFLMEKL